MTFAPCRIVKLCGVCDLLVNAKVSFPALAVSVLVLYIRLPAGFAAIGIEPAGTVVDVAPADGVFTVVVLGVLGVLGAVVALEFPGRIA